MNKEDLFDKAEAYYKDQLSKEERHLFEEEMAKDNAIAEEVKLYSQIINANDENDVVNLRATMKGILQEQHQERIGTKKTTARYSNLIIIGFLLLAMCLAIMLFRYLNKPELREPQEKIEQTINDKEQIPTEKLNEAEKRITPPTQNSKRSTPPILAPSDKLNPKNNMEEPSNLKDDENKKRLQAIAMAYYEVPVSIFSGTRDAARRSGQNSSIIEQARTAFKKGLDLKESKKEQSKKYFQDCIVLLNSFITEGQSSLAILYRAHAQFQLAQYPEAVLDFETVTKSPIPDKTMHDEAEWGLVLTWLVIGNDYQELLNKIIDSPDHDFHDEAIAIEKSLDK